MPTASTCCAGMPGQTFIGWPGLVYGGLLAMLVDCHSNWTPWPTTTAPKARGGQPAAYRLRHRHAQAELPETRRWASSCCSRRVWRRSRAQDRVICEVWAGDVLTVTADSVFVRVDTEKLKLKAHGQA
jgi:hypothetical protein